jgi:hypothetical protein
MSKNSELISCLEAALNLAKEQDRLVVPPDRIISTGTKFFFFPRHIFQKSTNKFVWRIGKVENVKTIRHYYISFLHPESSTEDIFYENRYEIP